MKPFACFSCLGRFAPVALVFAAVALAVGACMQVLGAPFVSDDLIYVTENAKLAGLQFTGLWRLLAEPYNSAEFLPLRDLSYWIDISLSGLNPSAFRLHNMLLYLLCCVCVYGVTLNLWRYFRPEEEEDSPWAAAVVTALFAIHPAHVEAVVWISGRKDVLAGMFSMLALWLAIRGGREERIAPRYAAAAMTALLAAMFSKATAVAVAPLIAMLWLARWRGIPVSSRKNLLLWVAAVLLLAAGVAAVFASNSAVRFPAYWGKETITRMLAVLGWSVRLAVTPEDRHFFYPVFESPWFGAMVAAGIFMLLAAAAGLAMLLRWRRPLEGFALVAFVMFCMPYLQLLPYKTNSLAADRFLFLAVWPVVLLIVALVWRGVAQPRARAALLLVVALPWAYQTFERPRDWRSFETLIDADWRAYPGHYLPASFKIKIEQGRGLLGEAAETAGRISNAEIRNVMLKLIRSVRAINGAEASAASPQEAISRLVDLGNDLEMEQIPAQARWNIPMEFVFANCREQLEAEWKMLVKRFPADAPVNYVAGLWLLGDGKFEDAQAYLRVAVESGRLPEAVRGAAFKNLGIALLNSGSNAGAETMLRAALGQAQPDVEAYCSLTEVYRRTGRPDMAARADAECRRYASRGEP